MENMVLATPILSDAATISVSTSPATLPGANLQVMDIKQVWRALNPAAAYVVIDLLAAKEINLVALLSHSGSSRSFARVRAAAVEADLTTDPDYDSGLLPFRSHQEGYDASWASGVEDEEYGAHSKNHFILWLGGNEQTFRYWRIDFQDPNSEYIDVGRLYVSKAWQPGTNMDYGNADGLIDPSRQVRTAGGVISSVERDKFRYREFKLSFANEDEMFDNAYEIERLRGATKDVLFIQDPTAKAHLQRRSIYGTMKALTPITNPQFSIYEKSFRIEEIPA